MATMAPDTNSSGSKPPTVQVPRPAAARRWTLRGKFRGLNPCLKGSERVRRVLTHVGWAKG